MEEWATILTSAASALAGTGVFTAIFGYFQNKKINSITAEATARNSETDYTERIIKQADDRVKQVLEDNNRLLAERDTAYAEAKGQRKAKQEWRDKFFAEQSARHAAELATKDTEAKLAEAEFSRCDTNGCAIRVPPRKRERSNVD